MDIYRTIIKTLSKLRNRIRVYYVKSLGVKLNKTVRIGKNVSMNLSSSFFNFTNGEIILENNCLISSGVIFDAYGGRVHLGERVFIGPNVIIYGHGNVKIGNDCLIAMGCKIISANHSIPSQEKLIRLSVDVKKEIEIGEDVWLGADVKVLAGVTIGKGCIVGAGSVITKNLEPFTIAVGVPARVIGYRTKSK